MLHPEIVPTILTQTEADYARRLKLIEDLVVRVQIDIMDGVFVPNTTVGASTVEKFATNLSRDIHLMAAHPLSVIGEYSRLGVDHLIFHAEACADVAEIEATIEEIKSLGNRAGLALNLETPVSIVERVAAGLDLVQLMAIEPGFSGENFNPAVLPRALSLRTRFPDLPLSVDGGVSLTNARELVDNGVSELVINSHLYDAPDLKEYLESLEEVLAGETLGRP